MNKRPSMQFYPGDWWRANDIKGCSMSTQGVWFNFLMAMWDSPEQGKIRGTKESLCRIIGATEQEFCLFLVENKAKNFGDVTVRNKIVTIKNRRMYSAYLARTSTKERVRRHRQQARQEGNRIVTPPSSSSTSTSIKKLYKKGVTNMNQFDKFWKAYPKKIGKGAARKVFAKIKPSAELLGTMLSAITEQDNSEQWNNNRPKYIPNPSTWLNQERWDDEPPKENAGSPNTPSHQKKIPLFPIRNKFCSQDGCNLPAVHRTGRDYDFYWCLIHIREKDKIKMREAGYDV